MNKNPVLPKRWKQHLLPHQKSIRSEQSKLVTPPPELQPGVQTIIFAPVTSVPSGLTQYAPESVEYLIPDGITQITFLPPGHGSVSLDTPNDAGQLFCAPVGLGIGIYDGVQPNGNFIEEFYIAVPGVGLPSIPKPSWPIGTDLSAYTELTYWSGVTAVLDAPKVFILPQVNRPTDPPGKITVGVDADIFSINPGNLNVDLYLVLQIEVA